MHRLFKNTPALLIGGKHIPAGTGRGQKNYIPRFRQGGSLPHSLLQHGSGTLPIIDGDDRLYSCQPGYSRQLVPGLSKRHQGFDILSEDRQQLHIIRAAVQAPAIRMTGFRKEASAMEVALELVALELL